MENNRMTRLAACILAAAALGGGAMARDLVWTGAESRYWDLTARNWCVAGDETQAPVAFESGDNVLFDDSATSFAVELVRVDKTADFQFDVGNVVFSNETQNYTFDADSHNWIYQRGGFGTIDKWGAGTVEVLTRLDTAKDLTCHQGVWKCRTGSNYIGEYRSCLGSLHDGRTVAFGPGSVLDLNYGFVAGAPTSAGNVTFNFTGAAISNTLSGVQNFSTANFVDSSYWGGSGQLYLTGNVTVGGTKPFVLDGRNAALTIGGNNAFRTVTVADVTGDDGYDMVVTNRLADNGAYYVNPTLRVLVNRILKKGPGTLAFMSNGSTTTGTVDVAEGSVAFDYAGGWNGNYSSVVGRLDGPDGAHSHILVRDGATAVFARNAAAGEINNPMGWELSVSNATLRFVDGTYQHFGTLRLHNATFDWQNAFQNTWFNYDFIGCSDKFVLSGDTPYDFQVKGRHPASAGLSDNCTFRLGFRLDSAVDDHPIAEAGTDPSSANWAKYSKFTNMWTVVDFVVEDITKDDGVDATMAWTIKDMPNMSYVTIDSAETWSANPWKRYRFHGGIRKLGKGTFRTTGRNTYTHTTEVAEGALVVDGTIATSSGVTVDAGAFLGGTGVVSSVTFRDGAGLLVPFARNRRETLQVASLATEGAVTVRVQNSEKQDRADFRQPLLKIADRPASLDLSAWTVDLEGAPSSSGFVLSYDAASGVVSASYNGGTLLIFR